MKKAVLLSILILFFARVSGHVPEDAGYYKVGACVVYPDAPDSYPVASNVIIAGDPRSGLTLYGIYVYSDADGDPEGNSLYQWYSSDNPGGSSPVQIFGATLQSYKVSDNEINKYIGFSVTPVALTGSSPGNTYSAITWVGPVINDPPVASNVTISGSKMVNGVLLGHYSYSDTEGDIESGSQYRWYSSSTAGGLYSIISGETGLLHVIGMAEQGKYFKFKVTPKAATGDKLGNEVPGAAYGPANTKPYANNLSISGTPVIGGTLKALYQYHDVDSDPIGPPIYRWFRESIAIPGADSSAYILTFEDVDSRIRFEVTPVSSSAYPDAGDPVMSSFSGIVTDPSSSLPEARDLCISGIRAAGQELTGKYHYVNNYKEKDSEYLWVRGNTVLQSGTSPGSMKYKITAADVDHEIRFAVIPRNNRVQSGDTAFSEPLVIFTLPRETFSVADPDILLTANPPGGIFWGEGVSNGKFSPYSVDYTKSPFTVSYQLSVDKPNTSCLQKTSKDLFVTGISLYFDSFRDVYCQNGGPDTIYVRNIPSGSILRQFHITDPDAIVGLLNDTAIIIDPGRMRAGNKEDTLFFQTMAGLSVIKISRPFVIDSVSQVTIMNLPPNSAYCSNLAPFELFVSHTGGVFEGPVTDSLFNPSLALGNTTVKYTFTTKLGCISSVNVPVTINPPPSVSFHVADSCIENSSDTTRFINTTISADMVKDWLWEFSEAGGSSTKNIKNPGYLYKTGGPHKVTLTATTVNNCQAGKDIFIDLGVKPVADFYWKKECFHPADSLFLFDSTVSASIIKSRSWNFFDGDSLHTVRNPKYPKKTTGYLPVEYIVKTNYSGCFDTVKKQIFIRPSISLTADDYFENFENGNGGWVKDYEVRNSWLLGRPARIYINSPASGNNAWYTGYNITDQKVESSSVTSPCFDFTAIQRPMIRMMLWKRFDRNRDGAALQYMIGDSGKWQYVGTLDDGINWYNSALIKGKPGGDHLGWTTGNQQDKTWGEASHRLDELVGKKDVKFRIAYGSDGTSQDNDGFAFDDIRIGPRARGVLLEHFTNNSSPASSAATALVSALANRDTADIINIQYHTNFPGSDPYYNDNPGDVSARFLFYGLVKAPYSFIDGGTNKNYASIFDYLVTNVDSNDLARRSLINPSFTINLNTVVSGGILTVSGQIKALEEINSENVTLYLAVTEKKNNAHTGALKETEFYNVFRKFIPDAGGISLARRWLKNETYSLTDKTWIIEKIPGAADIEVIAFIQNNITKEVYQAESNVKHNIIVGIENLFAADGTSFGIYPNPAVNSLTVAFEKATGSETDILIYDFSGALVRDYKTGAGTTEYNIDNPGLKSGIYLVKVFINGLNLGSKKLVVPGN